jgi:hypothetical protein
MAELVKVTVKRECAALYLVIAGLDPAIHASLKTFCEDDGSRGS